MCHVQHARVPALKHVPVTAHIHPSLVTGVMDRVGVLPGFLQESDGSGWGAARFSTGISCQEPQQQQQQQVPGLQVLSQDSKNAVQNNNSKISTHPDLATNLLTPECQLHLIAYCVKKGILHSALSWKIV